MKEDILLIIPSLQPTQKTVELVKQMTEYFPVIVVDDGSEKEYRTCFAQMKEAGAIVLRHAVNLGKGRALKTAFNYCLTHDPDILGVVTADADGQHLKEDMLACAQALREHPDCLVMGCRDFHLQNVPLKNGLGNRITSQFMKLLCGVTVSDTQTGLRGIPAEFMQTLMNVNGERFEFETNMLLETNVRSIKIFEVPIQTVYEDGGRSSHFNPLRDSFKIYALLFKFIASSVAGAVTDLVLFTVFVSLLRPHEISNYILISTIGARLCSATVNYLLNRHAVFKQSQGKVTLVRYILLATVQLFLSGYAVTWIFHRFALPETLLKMFVDIVLFFCSFVIQRKWVFASKERG